MQEVWLVQLPKVQLKKLILAFLCASSEWVGGLIMVGIISHFHWICLLRQGVILTL